MRLVVVSNRVPAPRGGEKAAAGGLAVALREALNARGGIWFGWSGAVADAPERTPRTVVRGKISYEQVDLTPLDRQEYYLGFSNRVLWPGMHYRLGLTEFSRDDYAGYLRVNHTLAQSLAPRLLPDDIIWVHDYHLLPFASALRELGVANRIGYFHHIPWPPIEIFGAIPGSRHLLEVMGAYDLIGLQTTTDAGNLVRSLVETTGATTDRRGRLRMDDRTIQIDAFPIGIDMEEFGRYAERADRLPLVSQTIHSLGNRPLVIGVDRLDYSKGIIERIEAFERFLIANPQQQGGPILLQITPESRSEVPEYAELGQRIDQAVGRINGALSRLDWTPVRFVKRAFSRQVLAGLYRHAAVGLVTPMRDGMNLVAKEYIAAQHPANPGVLVLSRFAGAAKQMTDALIVNPFDKSEVAEAISVALAMPLEERQRRFESQMAVLKARDIDWWAEAYLTALSRPGRRSARRPKLSAGGLDDADRFAAA
ncbi:MAG: trehalose-6-phosphate synthase [Reyranellaceae bacterium]